MKFEKQDKKYLLDKFDYDDENDILFLFSSKSVISEEVNEDLVIDLDEKNNIVGVEMFNVSENIEDKTIKIDKKITLDVKDVLKNIKKAEAVIINKKNNKFIVIKLFFVINKSIKELSIEKKIEKTITV